MALKKKTKNPPHKVSIGLSVIGASDLRNEPPSRTRVRNRLVIEPKPPDLRKLSQHSHHHTKKKEEKKSNKMAFVRRSFLPLKTLLNYHFPRAATLPPLIYRLPKSIGENTDATPPRPAATPPCWPPHALDAQPLFWHEHFTPPQPLLPPHRPTERRLIRARAAALRKDSDKRLSWSSGTWAGSQAAAAVFNSWPPGALIVLTEASLTESLLHLIRNLQLSHRLRRRPRGSS